MITNNWIEEYTKMHNINDLKYADQTFTKRDVKSMVKQLGVDVILSQIDETEIEIFLRRKKLEKIKNKINK